MGRLQDKIAVVTGGGAGPGEVLNRSRAWLGAVPPGVWAALLRGTIILLGLWLVASLQRDIFAREFIHDTGFFGEMNMLYWQVVGAAFLTGFLVVMLPLPRGVRVARFQAAPLLAALAVVLVLLVLLYLASFHGFAEHGIDRFGTGRFGILSERLYPMLGALGGAFVARTFLDGIRQPPTAHGPDGKG